ncbi:MAG: hypothetical protein AAF558_13970 [Verrucomicrobiota bacterium]
MSFLLKILLILVLGLQMPLYANQLAIDKMVREANAEQKKIRLRIQAIDKQVNPVLEKHAKELFFLSAQEFQFLRKQAENPDAAKDFFKKQDRVFEESLQDIEDYLDRSYSALQKKQIGFGSESELVFQDIQLYRFMDAKIRDAIRDQPEGETIIELLAERQQLKKKKVELGPITDYLLERRRWWDNHPGYRDYLNEADKS